MKKDYTIARFEDVQAKIYKKNMGDYRYLSPNFGYKKGYKFNQLLYIYIDNIEGIITTHCMKNATRKQIIEYLKEFKQSRFYTKNKIQDVRK